MRAIISKFDQQWDSDSPPNIEAFVSEHGPVNSTQLAQLLLVDQSHRWSRGQRVTAADYFDRFPDVRECQETAVDLLFAEFLLREAAGEQLSIEEFISPYPELATEFRRQIDFHRTMDFDGAAQHASSTAPATTSTTRDSWSHECLPGYEMLGELGRGGLGIVYLARDQKLNRLVALKMLLAGRFAADSLLKRLMLEAEATARLQHPNIVQIYEVGQHDGRLYLALEYISGGTLSDWMARRPQAPRDAAKIIRDLALAIHFAHEKGVIHRDLKPSNLLIQPIPDVQSDISGASNLTKSRSIGLTNHPISNHSISYEQLQINSKLGSSIDYGVVSKRRDQCAITIDHGPPTDKVDHGSTERFDVANDRTTWQATGVRFRTSRITDSDGIADVFLM